MRRLYQIGIYLFHLLINTGIATKESWVSAYTFCHYVFIRAYTALVLIWRRLPRLRPQTSRLLELPAEIRLNIWAKAVGGEYVLVRTKQHLWNGVPSYSLNEIQIGQESGSKEVDDDTGKAYWDEDELLPELEGLDWQDQRRLADDYLALQQRNWERVKAWKKCAGYRGKKWAGWGLLLTCKSIHAEAYPLLWSHTRFIILHNAATHCSTYIPWSLSFPLLHRVQKLHLHLRFNELYDLYNIGSSWYPSSDLYTYAKHLNQIKALPQLRDLSIYLEGPLCSLKLYRRLFRDFDDIAAHFGKQKESFVVRVPRPGIVTDRDAMEELYTRPVNDFLERWKGERWAMVLPDEDVMDVWRNEKRDRAWRGAVVFDGGKEVQYRVRTWYLKQSRFKRGYDEMAKVVEV